MIENLHRVGEASQRHSCTSFVAFGSPSAIAARWEALTPRSKSFAIRPEILQPNIPKARNRTRARWGAAKRSENCEAGSSEQQHQPGYYGSLTDCDGSRLSAAFAAAFLSNSKQTKEAWRIAHCRNEWRSLWPCNIHGRQAAIVATGRARIKSKRSRPTHLTRLPSSVTREHETASERTHQHGFARAPPGV